MVVDHPPFNPLEGCNWPDPDPTPGNVLRLNDVSRMSEVTVDAIFSPKSEQDVVKILQDAITHKKCVSLRGTQHSMGGQSLVKDGYVIDTKYLNDMHYSQNTQLLTVGVGCTWQDVIPYLNKFCKSPKILQSYCSFSVGGTLSVNAHGITSDESLASSVTEFRLAVCNRENRVEVITCAQDQELFRLALGGYGLFGVITQVTLQVADNSDLVMDSLSQLNIENGEFERIWDAARHDSTVDIKLARLNILTLETASLYIFRRYPLSEPATSKLSMQPKELSPFGRLLYKWALPVLKEYRQYAEETSGQALDMPPHNFETTRNEVLWESAVPLAKLYSPLVLTHDTFVLQEFFVPRVMFQEWIRQARPIFQEIDNYQKHGADSVPAQSLILLNTTIRYVDQDTTSFLSYSRTAGGMYAFVMYYRIKGVKQVDRDLGLFHNRLAEVAVGLGGTFYLPYRKCYSRYLLQKAYPQISKFARMKQDFDPLGIFSNEWFEHYILSLCSESYRNQWRDISRLGERPSLQMLPTVKSTVLISKEGFEKWLPRREDPLLERRIDSYRTLLQDKVLRRRFSGEFLVKIFNIADPLEVMRAMSKAAWDPENKTDLSVFRALRKHFKESSNDPISSLIQGWRAVRQLSHHKGELTNQTAKILHRLGWLGRVQGYLSVGDHGKTIRGFLEAGLLDESCQIYVAHDFSPDTDELCMNVVLERGALEAVGDCRVQFNYLVDDPAIALSIIPSGSISLVTLNQGLHHFPPSRLYDFLLEIRRLLQEGGLFIFREHDLRLDGGVGQSLISPTSAPVAMLDLAHSVFNAVTGVPTQEEETEIRAFRPLTEWRAIMESLGFVDSMQYGLETGDCTCDFMLCFRKEGAGQVAAGPQTKLRPASRSKRSVFSEMPIMKTIRTLLAQVPSSVTASAALVLSKLLETLPTMKEVVTTFLLQVLPEALAEESRRRGGDMLPLLPSLPGVLQNHVLGKLDEFTEICSGAQHLLRDIRVREVSNIAGLLSTPEIWLIAPLLKRKVTRMPDRATEAEKTLVSFVENICPALLETGAARPTQDRLSPESKATDVKPRTGTSDGALPDVNGNEVLKVILTLGEAIPGLLEPTVVLANSGLTLSQQTALVGAFAAGDLSGFADKIAWYHDRRSWKGLQVALVGDDSSVLQSKDLPTKEKMLSPQVGHAWYYALKAFLQGPRVQLKQQTLFGMRLLGLNSLCVLYNDAKSEALAESSQIGQAELRSLTQDDLRSLEILTRCASCLDQVKEVKIHFDAVMDHDLYDVAQVVSAHFGYKSLTSSLTDVTTELQELHADVQQRISLARSRNRASGMVDLENSNPTATVGWLPINEETLNSFRNKGGRTSELGDSMRKVVVRAGSLGLAGGNMLELKYIPLGTHVGADVVEQLCSLAGRAGIGQANSREDVSVYNLFKLSEWMQVEMIECLVKSLDHTPWYHFPFMEFLSTYFRALFHECRIVAENHGLVQAYGSMAFIYDLVPGIIMSYIFVQLQAIGLPLKRWLPTPNPDIMTEDLLLMAPMPHDNTLEFLRTIDSRVRDASVICKPGGSNLCLCHVVTPTYKVMGDILIKIGESIPSARVLQVSNQKVIQTLLSVEFDESSRTELSEKYLKYVTQSVESLEGLSVLFQYRYPMDVESLRRAGEFEARTVHLAVKVPVQSLLDLVRLVSRLKRVTVKQIYDFWTG